jgi:eukaryotic-like serine/threonine-protein kinase
MRPEFKQVKSIFLVAVEKADPDAREAYLREACGADDLLRRQVENLLRRHEDAGSFLERPPLDDDLAPGAGGPVGARTEQAGTQIGPYKLMQLLGEGGMGTVWVAEQTEPVKRRVALKVIKPGLDSAQVVRRFEAERQALALMNHSHIAKVLDAGATPEGRPYFVMELVKGVPITRYCDELNLPVRERLELFVPVCQAIQHAHGQGIVHRDIKPTNVLVCMEDGKAVPKIIDFGVAKALQARLTNESLHTEIGQLIGTLEYMAPEQAELSALDIDARTDVYALGVLLYELLTGTTPVDKTRLRSAAFAELLRIIKEEEPPRPSTRLTDRREGGGRRTEGGGRRAEGHPKPGVVLQPRSEPARLARDVRGELDWIVMRCLEKDRARSYSSASGLARDIERHLRDEAVEACPPSASYRMGKFLRRHRGAVVVTSAILLTLGAVLMGITWAAIQVERERMIALHAEHRARMEQARAEEERRHAEATAQAARANTQASLMQQQGRLPDAGPRDEPNRSKESHQDAAKLKPQRANKP